MHVRRTDGRTGKITASLLGVQRRVEGLFSSLKAATSKMCQTKVSSPDYAGRFSRQGFQQGFQLSAVVYG